MSAGERDEPTARPPSGEDDDAADGARDGAEEVAARVAGWVARTVSRTREEAEDVWAEAQELRRRW
jgi:hypothetical protein